LPGDGQRIDRWLWHARVVRTRALAAELAESGHVRLNGQRIKAPARTVREGDVLTIGLHNKVKVLRVVGFAERRGDSESAVKLYEDLSEPIPPREAVKPAPVSASRDPGSGRPTKRDRRALDHMRQRGPDSE
jgi:ribosome-associated heat shock protein Hsp15